MRVRTFDTKKEAIQEILSGAHYNCLRDEGFWEMVEWMDWKNLCKEKKDTRYPFKTKMLRRYGLLKCSAMREMLRNKYSALKNFLYAYDPTWRTGTGDDSTWDLCAHIVGLGIEEYIAHFKDPEKIIKLANSYGYVENFGYWIPRIDDMIKIQRSNAGKFIMDGSESDHDHELEPLVEMYRKLSKIGWDLYNLGTHCRIEEFKVLVDEKGNKLSEHPSWMSDELSKVKRHLVDRIEKHIKEDAL